MPRHHHRNAVLFAALLLLGCSGSATGPSSVAVAGTYYLTEPVARGGPVSGTILLTRMGGATRRIEYETGPRTSELVSTGTFAAVGEHVIELRLVEASGSSGYTWVVRATVEHGELVLTYPHPADGTVVERYRRVLSAVGR